MDLRGDYSAMAADFTVVQDMARYGPDDHAVWRHLLRRQTALAATHGCAAFNAGLARLGLSDHVPDFDAVSDRLAPLTGWRLVAVPGLIPDDVFFGHLAARRFPVTVWMRRRDEVDYLVEPDLFHDLFGHVPLLSDTTFAEFLQAYGAAGQGAPAATLKRLARLNWYTVEFGLLRTSLGLRAFGAGLLSSAAELVHATTAPDARRIAFDAARVIRTDYRIDRFQDIYMVLDGFADLYGTATAGHDDLEPTIAPGDMVRGDHAIALYDRAA